VPLGLCTCKQVLIGGQTLGLRCCGNGHRPKERSLWLQVVPLGGLCMLSPVYGRPHLRDYCAWGQTLGLQLLLVWAPSPVTVPVFTGGPTWWAELDVPGFREVPFVGQKYWGQTRGLQLQQFVWAGYRLRLSPGDNIKCLGATVMGLHPTV